MPGKKKVEKQVNKYGYTKFRKRRDCGLRIIPHVRATQNSAFKKDLAIFAPHFAIIKKSLTFAP